MSVKRLSLFGSARTRDGSLPGGWAGELPSAAGPQRDQVERISVEPSAVVWY